MISESKQRNIGIKNSEGFRHQESIVKEQNGVSEDCGHLGNTCLTYREQLMIFSSS